MDADISIEEKISVINHFTQQLINSGYGRDQIREIIESGLQGILRKEETKRNRVKCYRSSKETLESRVRKKLLESTNWYRREKNESDEDEEKEKLKNRQGTWKEWRTTKGKKKTNLKSMEIEGKVKIMSVIFEPHTTRSELAKRWRNRLEIFEKIGSIKLKVVERTGTKLVDLVHKSDPWSDLDCEREDCLLCNSSNSEQRKGLCKRRNVVYQTYCLSCQEKIEYEKGNRELKSHLSETEVCAVIVDPNDKENRKRNIRNEKLDIKGRPDQGENYYVKYIGETGRSGYERGKEHVSDLRNLNETSHLLKHYILCHQKDMKIEDMKFGMCIVKSFKTSFERQIGEAVKISSEKRKGTMLLNSKAEYNRCSIP